MTAPLVELNQTAVHFPIYSKSGRSLKKTILSLTIGGNISKGEKSRVEVQALSNLNLTLHEGERVGLIGHNGAGKTTLLRVLAGVYEPSGGSVTIRGRVSPLFDIAVGLEGDATGYENMYLRGLLLGMTPAEINAATPAIAEFSGLGDYLNMPIRTYSAGMMLRLAFSVATHVNPEVLLMDEWVSTGDSNFHAKVRARMQEIIDQSKVLIIASHDHALLKQFCTRIVVLEHGKIIADGPIADLENLSALSARSAATI